MPTITKLSELKFSYENSLKLVEKPIKIQIQINEKATSKITPSKNPSKHIDIYYQKQLNL